MKNKNSKNNTPTRAVIALIIAYVLWGVNTPLIKLGIQTIPIPIFMTIKIMGAALIVLPLAIKTWKPLTRRNFILLIISGVLWVSVGNAAFYYGLEKAPTINAALIELLGPLLLFILSVEFLREHLNLKVFLGIVIAFTGSLLIIGQPWLSNSGAKGIMIGNLMFVGSVLCHVIGTLIAKPILKKTSTYQATFLHLFFGVLPVAIISLRYIGNWSLSSVAPIGVVALIYGTVAVLVANFLLMYGLKRKLSQEVGVYFYIQPLVTISIAYVLLHEVPDKRFMLGGSLIFVGIYLVETKLADRLRIHYHHH